MLNVNKFILILFLIISIAEASKCTKEYIKPTKHINEFIKKTIGFDVLKDFNKVISKFQLKSKLKDNFMMACSSSNMYCAKGYYANKTGAYTFDNRTCCKSISYIKMLNSKYFKKDILNAIKKQTPSLYNHSYTRTKIGKHYIGISRSIYNSIDGPKYSKINDGSSFIGYTFSLEDYDVKNCLKSEKEKANIHKRGQKLRLD